MILVRSVDDSLNLSLLWTYLIDFCFQANSQPPPSSSAMADLISLDNGSKPPAEVIFDPLLQRSSNANSNTNHINNVSYTAKFLNFSMIYVEIMKAS